MNTLWQDIRYGARMLLKNRVFTLVAVLTLALGIGANTAIFSLVYSLLLRPLPYTQQDRIFFINNNNLEGDWPLSEPEFVEFRDQSKTFESMAAIDMDWVSLTGSGEPLRIMAMIPSAPLSSVLGVQPSMGRWFTAEEDRIGKNGVVVISDGLWKRAFGSDPTILGKVITLNDMPRMIIGIMPKGFQFLDDRAELWLPLAIEPSKFDETSVVNHNRVAIGRLKDGIDVRVAEKEMTAIAQGMNQKYPDQYQKEDRVHLRPVRDVLVGEIKTPLLLLLGAVGFVLLIACANVANLFLARGEARHKEIAIRTALGASASRIIRLLFVESILLAWIGGAVGLAIAFWGLDALIAISPDLRGLQEIKIDPPILGFTFLISALSGILFGMAPALQMARGNVQTALKDATRGTTSGLRGSRVRKSLVVSEIALSVVLVIGAGLLIRSFHNLQQVSPGFNFQNVLIVRFDLPPTRYSQTSQAADFYQRLQERINALPAVRSSAEAVFVPLFNSESNWAFEMEGRSQEGVKSAYYNLVSSDYFKTLEVPLKRGRFFSKQDQEKPEGAVIINETMARQFWPNEDPIGKRINVSLGTRIWREIVGVVGDIRTVNLGSVPDAQMYFPLIDVPFASIRSGNLIIRTQSNPLSLVEPVKSAIRSMDPNLPFATVRTLEEVVSLSVSQPRFTTALLGLFASIAMLLAAVGIYGVISYSVAQRVHEIGVRMALGARSNQILSLVVGQGVMLAAIGIGIGLVAALILTRLLSSLLFEVTSTDPATFVVISLLLGIVALIASYIPARRAAKVDPMIALRYE